MAPPLLLLICYAALKYVAIFFICDVTAYDFSLFDIIALRYRYASPLFCAA